MSLQPLQALPSTAGDPPDADEAVAELVEELANRLQAGEAVDLEACIRSHPEHAERLRRLLPAVRVLADLGKPGKDQAAAGGQTLGDFRLLREIGRGGMGVVYEAEQLSLKRRVAVKVLPFAAVLDQRQLSRFRNEAQAAALLQHPNIVPVYAVGHEQGVHFYAMQLIGGRTLATVIAGLRRQAGLPADSAETGALPPTTGTAVAPHQSRDFFRAVARLGVQAAQALEHAHQQGVIHRDVKPGNLLVEDQGKLWVADFGLASVQGGGALTSTGDLVGTLRYMSPEQAQSRVVDHRTDVYSLGVTLYEVLALGPAFPGDNRQELLGRVATAEPSPLRRLNPTTPVELQVIVGKAMAKDPGERYATAGALADDLQRFLDDRPILARPPSWRLRARRWARRHRPLVASLAVSVALLLAGSLLASSLLAVRYKGEATKNKAAKDAAETRLQAALFSEAAAVRRTAEPGYRKRVWELLHAALDLPVSNKDFDRVRAEVLASVGDPVGLEPIRAPAVARRKVPKIPQEFVKYLEALEGPWAAVRTATEDGTLLAYSRYNGVVEVKDRGKGWAAATSALGYIYDLQFTPDSGMLVAACEEGVVAWAVPNGKLPNRDFAHEGVRALFRIGNARSAAVDPSGQMVATVWRQIELWSLTTSRPLATLPLPAEGCRVEFSADGKLLLAIKDDRILCGWRVRETPEKQRLWGHYYAIPAVAFSPNGRHLASVSKDYSLRLWDAATEALKRTCKVHGGWVEAVDFSPDSKLVATGDSAGGVRLFDVESGQVVAKNAPPFRLGNHLREPPGQVWRLRFSRRGDRLAAAGELGLTVWTVHREGGKVRLSRLRTLLPPDGPPTVPDLAFHPGGDALVFLGKNGQLFSADLRKDAAPRRLGVRAAVQLRMLDFDAAGKLLTFITPEGTLATWDWHKSVAKRTDQKAHHAALGNGRWVATSKDRAVVVIDVVAGKPLLKLPPEPSDVWGLAWSPDCRRLAVSLSDGGLAIWDLEEVRARLKEFGLRTPSTVRARAAPP